MEENSNETSSDSDEIQSSEEIQSSDEVPEYDEEKIIKIAYAIRDYFSKDDPYGSKFYNNIDKDGPSEYYYDGICINSYDIFIFAMSIIDCGDDTYNNFITNPFDGDMLKYLKGRVSCQNSSQLFLIPYNNYVISKDPRWYLTVEFYNKLFDIVISLYW